MAETNNVEVPPETQADDVIVIHRPRLVLFLGVLAVVLAVFIATQVIGVLFAIVFPADVPLPDGVTQLNHENESYGVDTWLYGTDADACTVVAFYRENGGTCRVIPLMCVEGAEIDVSGPGQNVGECSGDVKFSIFSMRWNVNIATGYRTDGVTQFRLSREVFWLGTAPQPTPQPS